VEIGVGLIGYNFMGRTHSNAFRQVSKFFEPKATPVMKSICGLYEHEAKEAAEKMGWEGYDKAWQDMVARDDIGLIDITTHEVIIEENMISNGYSGQYAIYMVSTQRDTVRNNIFVAPDDGSSSYGVFAYATIDVHIAGNLFGALQLLPRRFQCARQGVLRLAAGPVTADGTRGLRRGGDAPRVVQYPR